MENELKPVDANDDKRLIKIILSVVSVMCCFVVGSIFAGAYLLDYLSREQASLAATEQVINTQAAATVQANATATEVHHATLVAGYEIYDDFDSNQHRWYIAQENEKNNKRWEGSISIRDGVYIWDVKEVINPGSLSWRDYSDQTIVENFDLSVDAKLAKGSPELLCSGVAFRVSPRSFNSGGYLFSICDSGVYSVQYNNHVDDSETIVPWTRSPAIQPGSWNTMSVHARKDHIELFINNSMVHEFSDTRVSKGYIYLMIRVFGDQPGTIYFDNFALQPLSE